MSAPLPRPQPTALIRPPTSRRKASQRQRHCSTTLRKQLNSPVSLRSPGSASAATSACAGASAARKLSRAGTAAAGEAEGLGSTAVAVLPVCWSLAAAAAGCSSVSSGHSGAEAVAGASCGHCAGASDAAGCCCSCRVAAMEAQLPAGGPAAAGPAATAPQPPSDAASCCCTYGCGASCRANTSHSSRLSATVHAKQQLASAIVSTCSMHWLARLQGAAAGTDLGRAQPPCSLRCNPSGGGRVSPPVGCRDRRCRAAAI